MGLLDFFKKKPPIEIEAQKVNLSEFKDWLTLEQTENQNKKKDFLKQIKTILSESLKDLKEKTQALENTDLESKKVDERAKFIIKENLNYYLTHLKNLTKNLENLKEEEPTDLIQKIDLEFTNFQKKSTTNFQKITFLIGKEVEDIMSTTSKLFKELKQTNDENQEIINTSNTLSDIESKFNELNNIDNLKKQIKGESTEISKKIETLQKEKQDLKDKLNQIKESEEYEEIQIKIKEYGEKNNELENQINQLKQIIDFKKLADIFHSDKKEMQLVKEYKNNFTEAFNKDNGIKLLKIIQTANLNASIISEEINEILETKEQINKEKPKQNPTNQIEKDIEKIDSQIEDLNIQKVKEGHKKDKFSETKQEKIQILKQELTKINVELDTNDFKENNSSTKE
ncbi:hypothetical protein HOD75_01290 [archaeon]|jgi:hypothetical protein|nr:hypothetical protein [archaeon]MBT4241512.1 hypothetical protein [archaeon]MBT4417617.1 hypothetical protein [archaeon]